jgi:hypothetical protein
MARLGQWGEGTLGDVALKEETEKASVGQEGRKKNTNHPAARFPKHDAATSGMFSVDGDRASWWC